MCSEHRALHHGKDQKFMSFKKAIQFSNEYTVILKILSDLLMQTPSWKIDKVG